MTDINLVKQYLWDWVNNYLNVPSPYFAGFPPCPYSRRAMLENRVEFRWVDGFKLLDVLSEVAKTWNDDFDVVILVAEPKTLSYNTTTDLLMQANHTILAKQDLHALKIHPDAASHLPSSSIPFNYSGKYVLVFVQRLSKLLEASEHLSKAGYYQNYTREELEVYVNSRYQFVDGD